MFQSNLRLVPWRNRDAWLKVYEDVYSDDSTRQAEACTVMETWLLCRNDVPPGIECTLNILSALQQESKQSSRHLQLVFSTAILRVVNMLCDNARSSGKETIYTIAKYYNLPDWIVNLRHDVSHGTLLPDLNTMKNAGKYLLMWLREYYWEVEKEQMKDIILTRSRFEACRDNVQFYIKTYLKLTDFLNKFGNVEICELNDKKLMYTLMDINKRRAFKCAKECFPWNVHSKEFFSKETPEENIANMKISIVTKHVINHLKDYICQTSLWGVDCLQFVIDIMLEKYNKHYKWTISRWEPLILAFNNWEVLDRCLTILLNKSNLKDEPSTVWFSEIYKSCVKRHHFDKLRSSLSTSVKLSNCPLEQDVARKTMLRKRLSLPSDTQEKIVTMKLFKLVEKRHKDLNMSPQLSSSVQYITDNCCILNLIKSLVLNPTDQTVSHLNYLFQLVDPEISQAKKQDLYDLILIKLGDKRHKGENFQIKTVSDLILIDKSENESYEEMDVFNNSTESIPTSQSSQHISRSGWNFNNCSLGMTPWDLEGVDYYDKAFDCNTAVPNYVFPIVVKK